MPPCWLAFRFLPDWFADGHHSWHSDGLLGIQFFRIPRQISWDESTARMHWVIQPFKLRFSRWPRRNFQRCHGKFNILEGFKMLQDLLGIERRLEASGWFLFFWGFGDTAMKLHGGFAWICHILPLCMGKPTRFLREPTRMSRNSKRAGLPLLHWINDVHPS